MEDRRIPSGLPAEIAPGVRELEHTADLGIEVRADGRETLFRRAASGMMALIRGETADEIAAVAACPPGASRRAGGDAPPRGSSVPVAEDTERRVELRAEDAATLLAAWLRELLYLREVEDFTYRRAEFERLGDRELRARVAGGRDPVAGVRELKGVTYHGLEVRREDGGWIARVIFDI